MSQVIQAKISGVRRKNAMVSMAMGAATIVGLVVLAIAVVMLLDWWIELPFIVRAAALAAILAAAVAVAVRYILFPILFSPDDEEIALAVERTHPDFRSRLISAVQFSRLETAPAGASPAMVKALIRETESFAGPMDFSRVITIEPAVRAAAIAALIVVLGMTGFAYGGESALALLKRAMLVPGVDVPRKTRVKVVSGDMHVARGDVVTLVAEAEGIVPRTGTAELIYRSGATVKFELQPTPENEAVFTRSIENVQESFTYRIFLNDARSDVFEVEAVVRPAVSSIEVSQKYPAYTNLGTARQPLGDLAFLDGSEMLLKIKANKPVRGDSHPDGRRNEMRLLNNDGTVATVPLTIDPSDRTALTHPGMRLPAGTRGFSIHLVDEHGLQSKDPAVYRVDLVPDRAPTVRVTHPEKKEELFTRSASIIVGFDAADDFSLGQVMLKYRLLPQDFAEQQAEQPPQEQTPTPPVQTIVLDMQGTPRTFRGYHEWRISGLQPPAREGMTLEWWVEVADTNNITGPGKAESEHYLARVVSESVKRAELMSRLGDYLGRISNVNDEQQRLNRDLGQMILEKPQRP